MRDELYYFLLGFVTMAVVAVTIISHNAAPETDTVCGKCGSHDWWFVLAEGEEHGGDR